MLSLIVPTLALVLAGCSSSSRLTDPQTMPVDLRSKTFSPTMVTVYRVQNNGDANTYSTVPAVSAGTTITTSPEGTSVGISTSASVSGQPVIFNQTLDLPPEVAEFRGPLHWPRQNASLSHMAFGSWDLPGNTAGAPATGAFFAFGNVTPNTGIPVTGTATYNGRWTGVEWTVSGGTTFTGTDVNGQITGVANFVTGSVGLTATQGQTSTVAFSGTLTFVPGTATSSAVNELTSSNLAGPVGSGYTGGTAVARFFGPAAEELGGTFRLTRPASPTGTNTLMGSFGMKR